MTLHFKAPLQLHTGPFSLPGLESIVPRSRRRRFVSGQLSHLDFAVRARLPLVHLTLGGHVDTSVLLAAGAGGDACTATSSRRTSWRRAASPACRSASVAMANGINANLVRRWVKAAEAERRRSAGQALPRSPSMPAGVRAVCRCHCRACAGERHPHRTAPRCDHDFVTWPARRRPSARRGCASCCDDPHRRDVAGGRAHRHARRRRPAAVSVCASLRRRPGAPRLPIRQRARHAHQAAGARRLRRLVRATAAEPGPLRLAGSGIG